MNDVDETNPPQGDGVQGVYVGKVQDCEPD
jgi:hypothetical protein